MRHVVPVSQRGRALALLERRGLIRLSEFSESGDDTSPGDYARDYDQALADTS